MELSSLGSWDACIFDSLSLSGVVNKFFEVWVFDTSIGDVIEYSIIEQHTILWNNADGLSQVIESQLTDVLAVNCDQSILNVVESIEQSHYC